MRLDEWDELGAGYPGEGATARALFDVLAPFRGRFRLPVYELGHEATPTPAEVWALAVRLAAAARDPRARARCRSC